MSRRPIIVHPRFWLLLTCLFLLVFMPLFLILNQEGKRLEERKQLLTEQFNVRNAEFYQLQRDLQYIHSDQGIEQYAREIGMIMPGEIRYGINKAEYE